MTKLEAEEMTQQFRALDALAEELGLVPSIYVADHICLQFQLWGI